MPATAELFLPKEIDLANCESVRDAITAHAEISGQNVVLNCSAVEYIDSMAMAMLIQVTQRLAAHGNRLLLAAPSHSMRRWLEITGLGDQFHVQFT